MNRAINRSDPKYTPCPHTARHMPNGCQCSDCWRLARGWNEVTQDYDDLPFAEPVNDAAWDDASAEGDE